MATPLLSKFNLPGTLGDLLVDVRSADRGRPAPAVIVLHGFKGFKDWGMFPPLAERLARAGFTAVSFNMSGSGVDDRGEFAYPERFGHNTFSAELDDLERVRSALCAGDLGPQPPSSVGLVGHSRGGGIAILATARNAGYRALVTWAAISHVHRWSADQRKTWREQGRIDVVNARTGQVLPMYTDTLDDLDRNGTTGLDIETAATLIRIPWLLVHGDKDEAVPWSEAARLVGLHRTSPFELLRLEGAGHTFGAVHPFAGVTEALDRTFDRTVKFLAEHLD